MNFTSQSNTQIGTVTVIVTRSVRRKLGSLFSRRGPVIILALLIRHGECPTIFASYCLPLSHKLPEVLRACVPQALGLKKDAVLAPSLASLFARAAFPKGCALLVE